MMQRSLRGVIFTNKKALRNQDPQDYVQKHCRRLPVPTALVSFIRTVPSVRDSHPIMLVKARGLVAEILPITAGEELHLALKQTLLCIFMKDRSL